VVPLTGKRGQLALEIEHAGQHRRYLGKLPARDRALQQLVVPHRVTIGELHLMPTPVGRPCSTDPRQHVLAQELDEVHPLVELSSQVEYQVVNADFPERSDLGNDIVGGSGDE